MLFMAQESTAVSVLPLPEKTNPITDDTDLQAWKWACLTFFDQV
jgi:hypothetical protein